MECNDGTVPEAGTEQPHPEDRRRFPRLRSSCRIRVKPLDCAGDPEVGVDALTVNISGGGLCYRSEVPVEMGSYLAVELSMPEFESPVVALARASFCSASGAMFDVGLEFWWVGWGDESAQQAISDYIKSELRGE